MSGAGDGGRPGRISIGIGATVLGLGLALTCWMALAGGYPSAGPLVLSALGVPPLLLGIAVRRSRTPGALARREGAISLAFVGGAVLACWLFTGVEREERFDMAWSFEVDGKGVPDRSHVLLEFVDHPGWVSRVRSRELGAYLESLGTDRVPVVYRVTRDFGSARGFIEVQVGERRGWKEEALGGFSRRGTARSRAAGGIGPSPFR